MVTGTPRRRAPTTLVAVVLLFVGAVAGCGGGDTDVADTSTTSDSSPQTTTSPSGPTSSSSPTEPQTTQSTATSSTEVVATLVAGSDGLGVASFGQEAEAAIQALIRELGAPDMDTGWQDPTDPSNEPLWPGCPGTTARLLQWTDNLGAVFTNWDGNLSTPGGIVAEPYFAGYGLWQTSPVRTADGASPGVTLGEARAIYGARISISERPDDAIELYSFAIDGTGSPLSRTGSLRGWLVPPDGADAGQGPDDSWTIGALTAGVSCDTP